MEGRISEPKEETTKTGKRLFKFSVAHEFKEKRDEETLLKTYWVDCALWNFKDSVKIKNEISTPELLTKGKMVKVTGQPIADAWLDKETGELKSRIKCNAESIEILTGE